MKSLRWEILKKIAARSNLSALSLVLPGVFALIASGAEGLSCLLLIPTLNALGGFHAEVYEKIIGYLPDLKFLVPTERSALVVLLIAGIMFSTSIKLISGYVSSLLTVKCVRTFTNELRAYLYERLLTFGKLYFDKVSFGHQQEILTTYVSSVALALSTLQGAMYAACCLIVYLTIMASLSVQLTLFVIITMPFLAILTRSIVQKLGKTSHEHALQYNELGRRISTSLSSIPLIKAYCAENEESKRFHHLCQRVAALEYSLEKKSLIIAPVQEAGTLIMLIVILLFLGLSSYGSKEELAKHLVYLLVLKRTTTLFSILGATRGALASAAGPANEVMNILNNSEKFTSSSGQIECPTPINALELVDLSFSYPNTEQTLHSLTLKVKCGEFIGIVGSSGSGKSTLIGLLLKFYQPTSGHILVNNVELSEIENNSWLSKVAYVGQDTYIFHGSIRENLLFGQKQAFSSEDEIWRALEHAQLSEFVKHLPDSLETLVGERGVQLSGGERQRLALARALLKKADIWILDEPTSSLDSTTEREIQKSLDQILSGKTTLMVAHRLSTLRNADRIFVINSGSIAESGTPKELLDKKGQFSALWNSQQLSTS